jgi:hypothetical protein
VLDASGNKGAGFVVGNTHWLGSKVTCDSIGQGYKITMSDRFQRNTVPDLLAANAPILLQFRMVYAKHSSPWQVDMQFLEEVSLGAFSMTIFHLTLSCFSTSFTWAYACQAAAVTWTCK